MDIIKTNGALTTKIHLIIGIWDGSVIDIETTGLDPTQDEIITFGYIEKNNLHIIQRTTEENDSFYNELIKVANRLRPPFYSYNGLFEQGFLSKRNTV